MKSDNPGRPGNPPGVDRQGRRLRELLRLGDPAGDGAEPSAAESAELRRVMLRSARTTTPVRWLPLATAATGAIAAAVLLLPGGFEPTATPPVQEMTTDAENGPAANRAAEDGRQIRFATENGTQIIWVLDPDLEL